MPKIVTRENDNTKSTVIGNLSNTVYIPGGVIKEIEIAESGSVTKYILDEESIKIKKPILVKTSKEFEAMKELKAKFVNEDGESGDIIEAPFIKAGMSLALAEALINNSCFVLFDIVVKETKENLEKKVIALEDKGLFDVKFICSGEFAGSSIDPIEKMIAVAEKRGDCVALIDHPRTFSTKKNEDKKYSELVHDWWKENCGNSTFDAGFTPWCSNTIFSNGDGFPMLPPSFSFLLSYANSIKSNPTWYAAAGSNRGKVPGLVDVDVEYGEIDIDILQCRASELGGEGDNVGAAINPICNIEPYDIIVWGNRTGLDNSGDLKATSFLNVRNLVCDIKKTMFKAARKFTFEQNSLQLWLNFCSLITPLLDRAKSGDGIFGYKLEQEETEAKARLKAKVTIVPIEAVEDFELTINMEDSISETTENA